MSEQKATKASHVQAQPFPLADDFVSLDEEVEETPIPLQPMTLDRLATMVAVGFRATNKRIDALAVRTEALEADAQWKALTMKVAKVVGPALVGAVAARFPEAAKFLGTFLQALGGVQ